MSSGLRVCGLALTIWPFPGPHGSGLKKSFHSLRKASGVPCRQIRPVQLCPICLGRWNPWSCGLDLDQGDCLETRRSGFTLAGVAALVSEHCQKPLIGHGLSIEGTKLAHVARP